MRLGVFAVTVALLCQMTYIVLSNDSAMKKRKTPKKTVQKSKTKRRAKVKSGYKEEMSEKSESYLEEPAIAFRVLRGGKKKIYAVTPGYGFFIRGLRKASNLGQVSALVEAGIPSKEVEPIIEFLDLKVPEVAQAAGVSPSTVSRWGADSSIGAAGSNQFFRIDEIIRKGVNLFGSLDMFKTWLHSPNMALGNKIPAKLLISQIGIDIVEEAVDALHYGNVM